MGYPGLDFVRLRICNDSLHATGFLGMQQFRVLTYTISCRCLSLICSTAALFTNEELNSNSMTA